MVIDQELLSKIRRAFLAPFSGAALKEIREARWGVLAPVSSAFADSLDAIHAFATVPYRLGLAQVNHRHFDRFHIAERIRVKPLVHEPVPNEEEQRRLDAIAFDRARSRFSEFAESDEGKTVRTKALSEVLFDSNQPAHGARELLLQACVAVWSALETLFRDSLVLSLNRRPELAARLLEHPQAKKHFEIPRFTHQDLLAVKFNLSSTIGDILVSSRDLSDIRVIRIACSALFAEGRVNSLLGADDLWRLNQFRHLVVHRSGIVDARFREATGSDIPVGIPVQVEPEVVERYWRLVADAGMAVMTEFRSTIEVSS